MKSKGCEFCNDLRNIQPAKYIGYHGERQEMIDFLKRATEHKKFILDMNERFYCIDKCPECGYVFTEEDYDSYY